ncbi:PhzF family phenazine biosynthesis protein, partial [Providencia rettgeri]
MSLSAPIYYVDAFTDTLFHGNPAAVVLLDNWLSDEQLIAIAAEINLSETAFLVGRHIRWFTPKVEVKLCGHATLAAAFVLNHVLQQNIHPLTFSSLSGCSGQLKLATVLEFFRYWFSDSFGGNP